MEILTDLRNRIRHSNALWSALQIIDEFGAEFFAPCRLSVWIWDPLHRRSVRLMPAVESKLPLFETTDHYLVRHFFLAPDVREEVVYWIPASSNEWLGGREPALVRLSSVDGFPVLFCLSDRKASPTPQDQDRAFGRFCHYACEGLLQARLREERDLIAAIADIASRSANRASFLKALLELMGNGFRAVGCTLFTVDPGLRRLVCAHSTGLMDPQSGADAPAVQYSRGEGCTGWVWERCRTVRFYNSRDPEQTARYDGLTVLGKSAESIPVGPLRPYLSGPILGRPRDGGDPVLGVVRIHKRFAEAAQLLLDERLLQSISPVIGAALERWEITAELDRKNAVHMSLIQLMEEYFAADDPDPPRMLQAVVDQAVSVFGASRCGVFVRRPDTSLVLRCETGNPAPSSRVLPPGAGLCGAALSSRDTIVVPDTASDHRFLAPRHQVRSEMCTPVWWRGDCLAVLNLDSDVPGYFRREDSATIELFEVFARIVGSALRWQAILEEAAGLRERWLPSLQNLSLSAMGAIVAHELKNGLCLISASTKNLLLLDANELPAGARHQVQGILRHCEQLFSVTENLMSRPLQHTDAQPVRPNDLVRAQVRLLAGLLGRKVQLVAQLDPRLDDVLIPANRGQLELALTNLVRNAAEASRPRQTVVVSTVDESSWVRLSVSDSGVGIQPTRLREIFEPFHSSKPGGYGVGLAIAKMIIEDHHHGRLEVSSTFGQGTTFSIWLPRADRPV